MKIKSLATAMLLLLWALPALCCDLCGYYTGLNPNFNQNQVGLRFRHRAFTGSHSHSADGHHRTVDRETYDNLELWLRWCPVPKLRVQALLPFAINSTYVQQDVSNREVGLGDVSVLAYYQVLQHVKCDSNSLQHRIFVGGGIGLPIGKYKPQPGTYYDAMRMPGSGAWSAVAGINYILRKGNWGYAADYNYRISTTNSLGYHFADRHNVNTNLYYQIGKDKITVLPFVGAYAEYARKDATNGIREGDTGGLAVFANGGLEAYWGGYSISLTAQFPALQMLNGNQGSNKTRLVTGVYYSF